MEQVKRDGQLSVGDYGAFVPHGRGRREATGRGVLDGLTFAVNDLIDVAGMPTGAGNPDWLAKQAPAQRSAPVVEKSLLAGATLVGKTVTANSPSASKAATFTIPI